MLVVPQLLDFVQQVLQVLNIGTADLDDEVVSAGYTVTLQHVRLLLDKGQEFFPAVGGGLYRYQRPHAVGLVRTVQLHV